MGGVRKLFSTSLSRSSYFFVGQSGTRLVSYSLQLACHPFRVPWLVGSPFLTVPSLDVVRWLLVLALPWHQLCTPIYIMGDLPDIILGSSIAPVQYSTLRLKARFLVVEPTRYRASQPQKPAYKGLQNRCSTSHLAIPTRWNDLLRHLNPHVKCTSAYYNVRANE
jgi:hypothetical protein